MYHDIMTSIYMYILVDICYKMMHMVPMMLYQPCSCINTHNVNACTVSSASVGVATIWR